MLVSMRKENDGDEILMSSVLLFCSFEFFFSDFGGELISEASDLLLLLRLIRLVGLVVVVAFHWYQRKQNIHPT